MSTWKIKLPFANKSLESAVSLLNDDKPPAEFISAFKLVAQDNFNFSNCPIFFIEGNIGCGKSTFLDFFKDFSKLKIVPEPLSWWLITQDTEGVNALEKFYKAIEQKDATFILKFELYALFTRVLILSDAIREQQGACAVLSERSI